MLLNHKLLTSIPTTELSGEEESHSTQLHVFVLKFTMDSACFSMT